MCWPFQKAQDTGIAPAGFLAGPWLAGGRWRGGAGGAPERTERWQWLVVAT